MGTQIRADACTGSWYGKPGSRADMIPTFFGYFTPVRSNRPTSLCNERPRRHDARVLSGTKPTYGSGIPALNSYETDDWGIGKGSAGEHIKASTAEGSLNLPRQGLEQVKNHYLPQCATIDLLTHTPDTRLQHPPLRYYK